MEASNANEDNPENDSQGIESSLITHIPISYQRFNQHPLYKIQPIHPYHHAPVNCPCVSLLGHNRPPEMTWSMPSEQYQKSTSTFFRKGEAALDSPQIGFSSVSNNFPVYMVPANFTSFNQNSPIKPQIIQPTKPSNILSTKPPNTQPKQPQPTQSIQPPTTSSAQSPGVGLPNLRSIPICISESTQTPVDSLSCCKSNVDETSKTKYSKLLGTISMKPVVSKDDNHRQPARYNNLRINLHCLQQAINTKPSQKSLHSKMDPGKRSTDSNTERCVLKYSLPPIDFNKPNLTSSGCNNKTETTFTVQQPGITNIPLSGVGSPNNDQTSSDQHNDEAILSSPESIPPNTIEDWGTVYVMKENSKNLHGLLNNKSTENGSFSGSIQKSGQVSLLQNLGIPACTTFPQNIIHQQGNVPKSKEQQSTFSALDSSHGDPSYSQDNLRCRGKQRKRKRSSNSADSSFTESQVSELEIDTSSPNIVTKLSNPTQDNRLKSGSSGHVTGNLFSDNLSQYANSSTSVCNGLASVTAITQSSRNRDLQPKNLCLRDLQERNPPPLLPQEITLQSEIDFSIKEAKYKIKSASSEIENLLKVLTPSDDSESTEEFKSGLITVLQTGCRLNSNMIDSLELYQSRQNLKKGPLDSFVHENTCPSDPSIPCLVQECPLDLRVVHSDGRVSKAVQALKPVSVSIDHKSKEHARGAYLSCSDTGSMQGGPDGLQQRLDVCESPEINCNVTGSSEPSPNRLYICEQSHTPDSYIKCDIKTHDSNYCAERDPPVTPVTETPPAAILLTNQPQHPTNNSTVQQISQDVIMLNGDKSFNRTAQTLNRKDSLKKNAITKTSCHKLNKFSDHSRKVIFDKDINIENTDSSNGGIHNQAVRETRADNEMENRTNLVNHANQQVVAQEKAVRKELSLTNLALPSEPIKLPPSLKAVDSTLSKRLSVNSNVHPKRSNVAPKVLQKCEVRVSRCLTSNTSVGLLKDKGTSIKSNTDLEMSDSNAKLPAKEKCIDNTLQVSTEGAIKESSTPGKRAFETDNEDVYGLMYSGLSPDRSSDSDNSLLGLPAQKGTQAAIEKSSDKLDAQRKLTSTTPGGHKPLLWWGRHSPIGNKSTDEDTDNHCQMTSEKLHEDKERDSSHQTDGTHKKDSTPKKGSTHKQDSAHKKYITHEKDSTHVKDSKHRKESTPGEDNTHQKEITHKTHNEPNKDSTHAKDSAHKTNGTHKKDQSRSRDSSHNKDSKLKKGGTHGKDGAHIQDSTHDKESAHKKENTHKKDSTHNKDNIHGENSTHKKERTHKENSTKNNDTTCGKDSIHKNESSQKKISTESKDSRHRGDKVHGKDRAHSQDSSHEKESAHYKDRSHKKDTPHKKYNIHEKDTTHKKEKIHKENNTENNDSTSEKDSTHKNDSSHKKVSTEKKDSRQRDDKVHGKDSTCKNNIEHRKESTHKTDRTNWKESTHIKDSTHGGKSTHENASPHKRHSKEERDATQKGDATYRIDGTKEKDKTPKKDTNYETQKSPTNMENRTSRNSTSKQDFHCTDKDDSNFTDENEDMTHSTPMKRKRKTQPLKKSNIGTRSRKSMSNEIIRPTNVRGLKIQHKQACFKVFDRVYNFSWSEPFRDEIKREQVPDYFQIVKRPMHLQLIASKLRQGLYHSIEGFVCDMRLIFSNCRLYHKPHPLQVSPDLLIAANNVEDFLDEQLRKVFPDLRAMATS